MAEERIDISPDETAICGCDCAIHIEGKHGRGWLASGKRQDGERVTCPHCGWLYEHSCDEAEGCSWTLILKEVGAHPKAKAGNSKRKKR